MKIEIAEKCGFCFGVKRAIKLAENSPNSATIGELIHNNLEIKRLSDDFKVKTLKNISELQNEKNVIIRTHGIKKTELENLQQRDLNIVDATCPFVKKSQKIAEEMSAKGYEIIIFGDEIHPEIAGIISYCKAKVYVVKDVEDFKNIKLKNKIALISQTTKKVENFLKIAEFLIKNANEVRVFNTICNATLDNQKACLELAKRSDIMIIIGGKNSSNTKQLHVIAKSVCEDSYLISSKDELEQAWFENKENCGISAGASTPDWIIQEVVENIRKI